MPPEVCPNCGSLVPARARACPECGADERTGWNDDAVAQRLGIPEDNFDHREFERSEFGVEDSRIKPRGIPWFWWAVAVAILAGFLWLSLGRR